MNLKSEYKKFVQEPTNLLLTVALVGATLGGFVDLTNAFGDVNTQVENITQALDPYGPTQHFNFNQTSNTLTITGNYGLYEDKADDILTSNGFNMTSFVGTPQNTTIIAVGGQ